MLVKLTDTKGKEYWVNPIYVKAVVPVKGGGAEVFVSFGNVWSTTRSIKVEAAAEEVAGWLGAAMPTGSGVMGYYAGAIACEEEIVRQQQQAAAAAAMGG